MTRLWLFPGLGADARMYARLGATGFDLHFPVLPDPRPGEGMPAYAGRVAAGLALRPDDWLGGCSFGAMVASEIARQRTCAGLVLLAGALDSATMGLPAPLAGALLRLTSTALLRRLTATDAFLRWFYSGEDAEGFALLREMLAATSDTLLREGARIAGTCRASAAPRCPIHALHGTVDRVLAAPPVAGLEQVEGAGHGLVFSHADRVTRFLARLCPKECP